MKPVIISVLALTLCYSTMAVQSKKATLGHRFTITLRETPDLKWSDPAINPVGIIRFEGPRKMVQSSRKGSSKIDFTFYALKGGTASIQFKQMRGASSHKIHEVIVTVK